MSNLKYKRVLLKISGEGFSSTEGFGFGPEGLEAVGSQIEELVKMGAQIAIVNGAGNLIRGETLSGKTPVQRVTADKMGMLATIINSMALQDVLLSKNIPTHILSAIEIKGTCQAFDHKLANEYLNQNHVVILSGGTGNPFFTTDTCAALRASEVNADLLIKATKVDGVYTDDPVKNPAATKYDQLSFDQVLRDNLRVMDHTAISLCSENNVDIIVCNLLKPGTIAQVLQGEQVGTLVSRS